MSDKIILSDRTKELSRSTGTGPLALDGAVRGFSAFGDFYSYGDAVFYAATDGTDYEVGSGQYLQDGSTNTLTRFPFRSTNSNNLVPFNEGIKEVYVTYPGKYSVFTGSGLGSFQEPKASGLAFWGSSQILNYDGSIVWDASGNNLGIFQTNPQHAIDIGGPKGYSQIRASGFLDGGSGILFSGVAGSYSGGRQLEPFLRNKVNNETGTDAVIALSGLVDESLLFIKQPEGFVFAGPPSGSCSVDCEDDYPTFRYLNPRDLPVLPYIAQYNDANPNQNGAIALYKESGVIKYDNEFVFKDDTNRLGVNTASPNTTLDVFGDVAISGAVTSYLVTTSGRLDHLLFGENELQTWNVAIGDVKTGKVGTRNINIGSNAGYESTSSIEQIGIGLRAGASTVLNSYSFFVGNNAGYISNSCAELVAIGKNAAYFATGCNYTTIIGGGSPGAGYQASGLDYTLGIGYNVWTAARHCDHSHAIGDLAGYQAIELSYSEAIGYRAGYQASGDRNIFIGKDAGYKASGDHNVFIGSGAGFQLNTGSNNLEIVTSGTLDPETSMKNLSYKININNVIHGDSSTKRLVVGNVSGVDFTPNATLEVKPHNATDVVSIVQGTTSQSADLSQWRNVDSVPLVRIKAADGAIVTSGTIYAYGSIETSGTVSASGGIELRNNVPSDTALKLYNDGGALKWAGSTVGTSTTNTFKLTDGKTPPETVDNGQTVIISGVSGVGIHFDASNRRMNINPSGLSGVCFSQIGTVSGYLDTKIGGLPGGYGHWKASDGTLAGDTITSTETVFMSGVSGVHTHWNSSLNRLEISPSGLSGVLQEQIDSLNAGAATVTAGSGLTMVGTQMNMDVNGSGQLEHLVFNDNQIRIGEGAGDSFDLGDVGSNWTAIGYQAGYGASGNTYTNIVGYQAGVGSSGCDYSNLIGTNAGLNASGLNYGNMIGWYAGGEIIDPVGVALGNIIGAYAGYQSSGNSNSNMIGSRAGQSSSNFGVSNLIGYYAGQAATKCLEANMIGFYAGYYADACINTNMIGREAGYRATGCDNVNAVGRRAGSYLLNTHQANTVGDHAGAYASGNHSNNMIGTDAGYKSSGCTNSNMIGSGAGMHSWDAPYSNILGAIAGSGANKSSHINAIGNYAVSNITACRYLDVLGRNSAGEASGVINGVILGSLAGYNLQSSEGVSIIGNQAGRNASGCIDSIMIGSAAGSDASGCLYSNMIGTYAGFKTYDSDQSTMIGGFAGFEASNSQNSVMLGHYAGHNAPDSSYCTYIGYYAGKSRRANNNLIIKTNNSTSNGGASWADTDKDDVFDIAGMFNGVSEDSADSPITRQLRIGMPPDSVSDLSNICTSIKSKNAEDVVLKLLPTASQTAAVMQTSRLSDGTAHEIINKDGYLRIPVADYQSGSDLYTGSVSEANKIPKTEGAVCAASLSGDEYLCVCIGTTWYKTTDLTAL